MEEREAKDAINDFGRDPVGEGKEERVRFLDYPCHMKLYPNFNSGIQYEIEGVTGRRTR